MVFCIKKNVKIRWNFFETKKGTATRNEGDTFWRRGATYSQCGNMKKFTLTIFSSNPLFSNFFRKTLLSRNFRQKGVRVNFRNFHTVALRVPKLTDWGLWYSDCGALVMLKKECFDGTNGPQSFHKTVSQ